jgi:hypothetical protein
MFYRWRRMEEEDRERCWRLYGWFTALMACGSCVGAVTWAAHMMYLVSLFTAADSSNPVEKYSRYASDNIWFSAYIVTYAFEFLCLSAAKLMVLDRLSVFAAPEGTGVRRRWTATSVVMAAVVLGNAVGLAGNVASAVHYLRAADALSTLSAYYAANSNDTSTAQEFSTLGLKEAQLGGSILSVQRFSEVAVLLLIVVAFVVVGVLSVRRVSSRLLQVNAASAAAATGRALRRRMLGTTAFVFVTFLLRSVLSTITAVTLQLRDLDRNCPVSDSEKSIYCSTCRNVYSHITGWMVYTPAFQTAIVVISSPFSLLVALWGMTSKATLHLMKSRKSNMQEMSLSGKQGELSQGGTAPP